MIDWVQDGLSTNKNSEGLAYFYCNKQENKSDDPCQILRSIIRQLATGPWAGTSTGDVKTVHKKVYQLWKTAEGPGIASTFSQWEECLVALINTFPRTTIVLDALDECGNVEQKALIEMLVSLASPESKCKPVKIFVSTRPDVLHKHHLDEYPAIQMQQNHHANDIAAFVRTKITDHPRWSRMTTEFKTEIVDTLLKRSGDMFLFASLQIQQLLLCDTGPDLRECLAELPKSLEETYEDIYQRATAPGKDRKKLLDRALRWVLCAVRPLTTHELLYAISQDFESDRLAPLRWDLDEAWISNLCHNFLSLDSSHDNDNDSSKHGFFNRWSTGAPVWRLAHQAVADFLEKSDWCNNSRANYHAGTICLTIMIETFSESACDDRYDSHVEVQTLNGLKCPCGASFKPFFKIESHAGLKEPLADYASRAWPIHLRALQFEEAHGANRLSQTLEKFLGAEGGTSLAYEKWRRHTYYPNHFHSRWDYSAIRVSPPTSLDNSNNKNMSRLSFASYFGFFFLLLQCLSSSSSELETSYLSNRWSPWPFMAFGDPLWWSLVALACAHNETEILEHLFDQGAERNTTKENEVPPIVAAAIGDSKEAAQIVLNRGTAIRSSFTGRHGHVLAFAIKYQSLKVLRLLLDHIRNNSDPLETERGLSEVSVRDLSSEDTIRVMLEADVKVDLPLKDGTLLVAAIRNGWKSLVRQLLEQGADVNMRFEDLRNGRSALYDDALEASLKRPSDRRRPRDQLDSLVYLLIDKHRARISARHVGRASTFKRSELVQVLLGHDPDLNETYTLNGNTASALVEAVVSGSETDVRLLIEHKADASVQAGGVYGNALGAAFGTFLIWPQEYPVCSIIEALIQGGDRLDKLTGNRLSTALAAAAHAGLEDTAKECLKLGADPNALCDHRYATALGAAAASDHPLALDMIRILLDNSTNVNAYFPRFGFHWPDIERHALDFPLQEMLERKSNDETDTGRNQWINTKLRMAETLVSKGAVWDINFAEWFHSRSPYLYLKVYVVPL